MKLSELHVGQDVHYHPIISGPHDGKIYRIRTLGTLPGGTEVAWLQGKSGCVAATALSPTEEAKHGE